MTLLPISTLIELVPLAFHHFDELISVGSDERIWEFHPENRSKDHLHRMFLENVLLGVHNHTQLAFVVRYKLEGRIIGLARFFHINLYDYTVEMGTWLTPDAWGKGINLDLKYTLLRHLFEQMAMQRVQFRTDVLNMRSQMALHKLGAQLEGRIRKERIRWTGAYRDVYIFSILREEWDTIKVRLEAKLMQEPSFNSITDTLMTPCPADQS
jgi:N-acetyltransferase